MNAFTRCTIPVLVASILFGVLAWVWFVFGMEALLIGDVPANRYEWWWVPFRVSNLLGGAWFAVWFAACTARILTPLR